MTKKLKSAEGKQAFEKRQRVWKHNSFRGHARMMEMNLKGMLDADSVSAGTKYFIKKILIDLDNLKRGLETRIDPQ